MSRHMGISWDLASLDELATKWRNSEVAAPAVASSGNGFEVMSVGVRGSMRWRGDNHSLLGSLRLSLALCSTFRSPLGASLGADSLATCSELAKASSGALRIDSSALQKPSTLVIADSAA